SRGAGAMNPEAAVVVPGASETVLPRRLGRLIEPPRPLQHPMDAYLGSLSPNGARAMRERLRAVARLIGVAAPDGVPLEEAFRDGWHQLTSTEVEFIRQRLLERGAAPSTVNLTLAALKGIARYARKLGLMTMEAERNMHDVAGA